MFFFIRIFIVIVYLTEKKKKSMSTLLLVFLVLFFVVIISTGALLFVQYAVQLRQKRMLYAHASEYRHRRLLRYREIQQNLWRRQRLRDVVRLLLRKGLVEEGIPVACQLPGDQMHEVHVRREFSEQNRTEYDDLQEAIAKEIDNRLDVDVRCVLHTPLPDLLAHGRPPDALDGPDLLQLLLLQREDFLLQQHNWEMQHSSEGVAGLLRVSHYDEDDEEDDTESEGTDRWWTRREPSALVTHTLSASWRIPHSSMRMDESKAEGIDLHQNERAGRKGDPPTRVAKREDTAEEEWTGDPRSRLGGAMTGGVPDKETWEEGKTTALPARTASTTPTRAERERGDRSDLHPPFPTAEVEEGLTWKTGQEEAKEGRPSPPPERDDTPAVRSVWFSPLPLSPHTAEPPLPPPPSRPFSSPFPTPLALDDGEPSSLPLFSVIPTGPYVTHPFPPPSSLSSSSFLVSTTASVSSSPPLPSSALPLPLYRTDFPVPQPQPMAPLSPSTESKREVGKEEEKEEEKPRVGREKEERHSSSSSPPQPPPSLASSSPDPNADVLHVITHFLSDITSRPLHEVMQESYSVVPVEEPPPPPPATERRERNRGKGQAHTHHTTRKKKMEPHHPHPPPSHTDPPLFHCWTLKGDVSGEKEEEEEEEGAIGETTPARHPATPEEKRKRRSPSFPPSGASFSSSCSFPSSSSCSSSSAVSRESNGGSRTRGGQGSGANAEVAPPPDRGTLGPTDRTTPPRSQAPSLLGEDGDDARRTPPPPSTASVVPIDTATGEWQDDPTRPSPIHTHTEGHEREGAEPGEAPSPSSPLPLTLPTTDRSDIKRLLRRHRQLHFPPMDPGLVYGEGFPYTTNLKNKQTRKRMLRELQQSTAESIEMELSLSIRPGGSVTGKRREASSSFCGSPSASILRFFAPPTFRPSEKKNVETLPLPTKKGSTTQFPCSFHTYPSPPHPAGTSVQSFHRSVSVGFP